MKNDRQVHGEQKENPRSESHRVPREYFEWIRFIAALVLLGNVIFWGYRLFSWTPGDFSYSQVEWFMWGGGAVALLMMALGYGAPPPERKSDPEGERGTTRVLFFRKSPKTPEKK